MANVVDWQNPQKMSAPRKDNPDKRETKYLTTCDCGYQRWLSGSDARHAEQTGGCIMCVRTAGGHAAWDKHVQKYGDQAYEKLRRWRKDNPSYAEKAVLLWLTAHAADFTWEHEYPHWTEDGQYFQYDIVVFRDGQPIGVLEVDGWGHVLTKERDALKAQLAPAPVARLAARQVQDGSFEQFLAMWFLSLVS